jgi:hypothetical protein
MLVAQRFSCKKRVPVVEKPSCRPSFGDLTKTGRSGATLRTPASLKGSLTRRISSRSFQFIASWLTNAIDQIVKERPHEPASDLGERSPQLGPTRDSTTSSRSTDTIGRFKPAAWRLAPAVSWPRYLHKVITIVSVKCPKVNSLPRIFFPGDQTVRAVRVKTR